MLYTIPLENLCENDYVIAGHKAVTSAKIRKLQASSALDGFVIPTYTFEIFLEACHLTDKIKCLLSKSYSPDEKIKDAVSNQIAELIISPSIPSFIYKEIQRASDSLHTKFLIIRSSAVSEDEKGASWAGQLKSVMGSDKYRLERHIKEVWASSFLSSALLYGDYAKNQYNPYKIAVLVQPLVVPEASGVAMIHSNENAHERYVIEAVPGFGSTLASGKVSPDVYVTENEKLVDILVENKLSIDQFNQGYVVNETLKGKRATNQVLDKPSVETLSKKISLLKSILGLPLNIEWAKVGNKFYVLQGRPIATEKIQTSSPKEILTQPKPSHVWFAHKQVQALAVTELWSRSESLFHNLVGTEVIDLPFFVHEPNLGVDVYYHKNSIHHKPYQLLNFYENNFSIFEKAYDDYLSSTEQVITNYKKPQELQNILFDLNPKIETTNYQHIETSI